jgi:hypothetical protein
MTGSIIQPGGRPALFFSDWRFSCGFLPAPLLQQPTAFDQAILQFSPALQNASCEDSSALND